MAVTHLALLCPETSKNRCISNYEAYELIHHCQFPTSKTWYNSVSPGMRHLAVTVIHVTLPSIASSRVGLQKLTGLGLVLDTG